MRRFASPRNCSRISSSWISACRCLNGLDAAAQIIRENERVGVIILSMYTDESYIVRALDAGARGYLLKDNADDDIERAIRSVALGVDRFSRLRSRRRCWRTTYG